MPPFSNDASALTLPPSGPMPSARLGGGRGVGDDVSTLHVTNLPMDCTERELYLLFATFPGWEGGHLIHYSGQKQPMAFVCFSSRRTACVAQEKTHGIPWAGGEGKSSRIRCAFAAQQSRSNRRDRRFTSANVPGSSSTGSLMGKAPEQPLALHDVPPSPVATDAATPKQKHQYAYDFLCSFRHTKSTPPTSVRASAVYVRPKRTAASAPTPAPVVGSSALVSPTATNNTSPTDSSVATSSPDSWPLQAPAPLMAEVSSNYTPIPVAHAAAWPVSAVMPGIPTAMLAHTPSSIPATPYVAEPPQLLPSMDEASCTMDAGPPPLCAADDGPEMMFSTNDLADEYCWASWGNVEPRGMPLFQRVTVRA